VKHYLKRVIVGGWRLVAGFRVFGCTVMDMEVKQTIGDVIQAHGRIIKYNLNPSP
jgi:hypothetical protein